MALLYSLEAFRILFAALLVPDLLLLMTMFLMLLHIQGQVLPHLGHPPAVGSQISLEISVTSES